MSFPACPSCSFPDVPVADRAVEVTTACFARADETRCTATTTTVHRGYRCAGCGAAFWTAETVQATGVKTPNVRPLFQTR